MAGLDLANRPGQPQLPPAMDHGTAGRTLLLGRAGDWLACRAPGACGEHGSDGERREDDASIRGDPASA